MLEGLACSTTLGCYIIVGVVSLILIRVLSPIAIPNPFLILIQILTIVITPTTCVKSSS